MDHRYLRSDCDVDVVYKTSPGGADSYRVAKSPLQQPSPVHKPWIFYFSVLPLFSRHRVYYTSSPFEKRDEKSRYHPSILPGNATPVIV
jgi:hypothetical protein